MSSEHQADFLPLRPLPDQGTIGVIAPSSPINQDKLQRGIAYLEQYGYRIKTGKSCHSAETYLAGPDELRAGDLMEMVNDDEVDAIFCARGGFGSLRILEMLDYDLIAAKRKMIVGYSDVTALHWAIFARTGLPGFSAGMVASDFGKEKVNPTFEKWFWPLIKHGKFDLTLQADGISPQKISGTAMTGTLSVLTKLIGTRFYPEIQDPVFIFEDIEESMHKIEGFFQHLIMAGKFKQLRALLLGFFTPDPNDPNGDITNPDEIFSRILDDINVPALTGLSYGHIDPKIAMPVGLPVELKIDQQQAYLSLAANPFRK